MLEETGYNMRPLAVNNKQHFVQSTIATGSVSKQVGMFLVPGVSEAFAFAPQCEGEIAAFSWFNIDDVARVHAGVCTLHAGVPAARVRFFQV